MALLLQLHEVLRGLEHGEPFDLIQCTLLPGQLHDGGRRTQSRQIRTHQGLVGVHFTGARREDGLQNILHPFLADELLEFPAGAGGIGLLIVHLNAEFLHPSLGGMLDLIHRKIGVALQHLQFPAVFRIPGDAAGNADTQFAAAGQHRHALLHGTPQHLNFLPHLLLAAVTIEQQQEFIAGQTGTHRAGGGIGRNALAGAVDVLIAPVMAVGIVDVLEVVQIHHQQCSHAQTLRLRKQLLVHPVEGLAVVQAGEDVVIALVLDAHPFQRCGGHILGQTHLHMVLVGDTEHDVAGHAILPDGQQFVPLRRAAAGVRTLDAVQDLLEPADAQRIRIHLRLPQQGKEIFSDKHAAGVVPQFIAAQFHAGHIHDAQELGGAGDQAAVQLGDGLCKTVQFPDAGVGQPGEGPGALCLDHLAVQLFRGMRQGAGHDQTADDAQNQCDEDGHEQNPLHGAGKGKQRPALHRAHQDPVFLAERCVAAVQHQRFQRRIIFLPVQLQPAAAAVPSAAQHCIGVCPCGIIAAGRDRLAQREFLCVRIVQAGYEEIGTGLAALQLTVRQLGFQIAR